MITAPPTTTYNIITTTTNTNTNTNPLTMKHSLLFLSLLSLLFLGSCASDDALTEQTQDPEPDVPTIPFTGTITSGNGPSAVAQALVADDGPFHALSDEGTTLKATWEVGDELALIVNSTLCKATVSEVDGNKAYISASVPATVSDGAEARFIYPYTAVDAGTLEVKADLLSEQDGTLATIAKNLDVCKGSGVLSVANGTAKLKADVTMAEQYCIWRLATQYNGSALSITKLTIAQGSDTYTVNLSSAASSGIYVALKPAASTAYTFRGFPTIDGAAYKKDYASVTLAAQMFYRSTLNLDFDEFWFPFSHYTWDAKQWYWYPQSMMPSSTTTYPTVNYQSSDGFPTAADPDRWYNTITAIAAHQASNSACRSDGSARNMPCYNALTWYLTDNVYWDNTTVWYLGGDSYQGGIWLKKWDNISGKPSGASITNCASASGTTGKVPTIGKPSNTADYFFLPALGIHTYGMLFGLGTGCHYCSSSPTTRRDDVDYSLDYDSVYGGIEAYGGRENADVAGSRPDGSPWFK